MTRRVLLDASKSPRCQCPRHLGTGGLCTLVTIRKPGSGSRILGAVSHGSRSHIYNELSDLTILRELSEISMISILIISVSDDRKISSDPTYAVGLHLAASASTARRV
jgi:hypothetical protein